MVLALGCYPKTYPKNTYAQTIRQILKDSGFPGPFLGDGFSSKKRHHHKVTVGWEDKVQRLTQIGKLADDAGFQFYCNADGHPVLRTQPKHPNNVIGSLDGLVTVDPTTTVAGTLVNRVQVAGKKPAFQGAESAAAPHPLAPALLAYYGVPRYYNEEDTSNHAKSDKAAREKAGRILTHRLHALKEAQAASIAPLPNLDPLDVLLIGGDRWIADQFSIPVAGGEMTVGYNAVINRPHIRRVPATAVPKRHHHRHKAKGGKGK